MLFQLQALDAAIETEGVGRKKDRIWRVARWGEEETKEWDLLLLPPDIK